MYWLIYAAILLTLGWIGVEFQSRRWVRILLGASALLLALGIGVVGGVVSVFNSNVWFGEATRKLIDTTIEELEAGNTDHVVKCLRELRGKYSPTYENRARYDELVQETIVELRGPDGNAQPTKAKPD